MSGCKAIPPRIGIRGPGLRSGMVLLITLLIMGLMTIIVVAFLGTMNWEVASSRRDYDNQKARALAMMGMNTAVSQLRTALGVWDNPLVNFTNTTQPYYYWSVSPGILTRWAYTNTVPLTNYPLFSIDPNGATNLVNLNAVATDGTYPIGGGANPPNISVYWANVLANPTQSATKTNQIIGRYAFWVDDENAKININTADGTLKYTTSSLGLGTPSEVSLQVLQDLSGGAPANLASSEATNIVYLARTTGFNSTREIVRASGATPYLYTNNNFSLTCLGRSPEMNVWGEPKINMISLSPLLGGVAKPHGALEINNVTGQPVTEIYPTPAQLPPFSAFDALYNIGMTNGWRPLAFTEEWPVTRDIISHDDLDTDGENVMMDTIAMHLGGTNSVREAVQWPYFPGATSTTGFLAKYSLRQLDTIATQITDLGTKAVFPEQMSLQSAIGYPMANPSIPWGYLSQEQVVGWGRSAKINEIYIYATVNAPIENTLVNPPTYTAPSLKMQIYVESFLPAGFGGVDLLNQNNGLSPAINLASNLTGYDYGEQGYYEALNILDLPAIDSLGHWPGFNSLASPTNGVPANAYSSVYRTNFPAWEPATATNNYWSDCIMTNDAGIDFTGNASAYADPDQTRAQIYHSYWMTNASGMPTNGYWNGTGVNGKSPLPILQMSPLDIGTITNTAWYPGQYRTVGSRNYSWPYFMTNANSGGTLHIGGGLVVTGNAAQGNTINDPAPTPLEAGVQYGSGANGNFDDYNENHTYANDAGSYWSRPPTATNQTTDQGAYSYTGSSPPGRGIQETYRDRLVAGSIPISLAIPIPPMGASTNGVASYDAAVADPLVNQFPGDWVSNSNPTVAGSTPTPATLTPNSFGGGFALYYGSAGQNIATVAAAQAAPWGTLTTYFDPDSFWMPTLDPLIPRSARFPNIGYLNYLRTGVIPDNETVSISQQHGTPYRCLNFNSASDPSQLLSVTGVSSPKSYPDWALLDLFTMPSTLLPYGGPYGYYNSSGVWTAGALFAGNPTNMYNYGTWGGSTPGRINPNGSIIYTTNVNIPTPNITRLLPLEALMYGLTNNATIASGQSAATATIHAPTFTGGSAVAYATIAQAIATYLANNANGIGGNPAPLREPGELCNIPAIASLYPNDRTHYNPTRNDLIRQIIGDVTTQSNVFSVWVAGESISKSAANSSYGTYEPGDQVTGSVRYHFVIDRELDRGVDGIVGNSLAPLPHGSYPGSALYQFIPNNYTNAIGDVDGVAGTYDDPTNTNDHPVNPRYLYRVIYAEEIR